jgi:hypothetical protein
MKPVLAFGRSPFRLIPTAVALVLMAACLLGRDAAHAQTSKAPSARPNDAKPKAQQGEEPELRGEWRRAGAGFACTVKSRQQIPPEKIPEVLPGACLYLGPFGIGKSATTVKARLGEPHRTVPQQSGAVAWMYFLEAAEHRDTDQGFWPSPASQPEQPDGRGPVVLRALAVLIRDHE